MNHVGLHIIGDGFDPSRLVGPGGALPRVVKLVDPSVDFKRRVRQAVGPDCLIVVRFYEAQQALGAPQTNARDWYQRHVGQMTQMTDPNVAFEGYNEISDAVAEAYCAFEVERLKLMHAAGLRAVVGNFSVGTPDVPVWNVYAPMLAATGPADLLGLHEYWGVGADIDNRWFCGRWNLVPQLANVPVVVTECGRDAVNGGPGGWKRGTDASTYISEIAKYAQVLDGRPACVFTGGNAAGWEAYDVNDIWPRVTQLYMPPVQETPGKVYTLRRFLSYWPRWKVSRPFGYKDPAYAGGWHKGADLIRTDGGTQGAVVRCPFDRAVVDIVSWREDRGWYIYLWDKAQGVEVCFYHLSEEPYVRPGQPLRAGDPVGHVGNTGALTTGPHLHFGVCRVDDNADVIEWIDPFGPRVKYEDMQ